MRLVYSLLYLKQRWTYIHVYAHVCEPLLIIHSLNRAYTVIPGHPLSCYVKIGCTKVFVLLATTCVFQIFRKIPRASLKSLIV